MRTRHSPALAALGFLIPIAACTDVATAPPTPPAITRPQMTRTPRSITITNLGSLGGTLGGEASAINSAGQIVGYSYTSDGDPHAFLWENGVMTDLGTLGGRSSFATDINEAGEIVGSSATSSGCTHAFLWKNGVMIDLNDPLECNPEPSGATAINPAGEIVGTSPDPDPLGPPDRAVIWKRGRPSALSRLGFGPTFGQGINPAGDLVGFGEDGDHRMRALLWRRGGDPMDIGALGDDSPYALTSSAYAFDINPGGVVVGITSTSEGLSHAFRWRAGEMTDLGALGGPSSKASRINPAGQIVGWADALDGHQHAVLWQGGEILDLGTSGTTSEATDIGANGQVVGSTSARPGFEEPDSKIPVLWTIR
ncbi:MAG TPA: hypothetical protein VFK04_14210 [Gemmatimonadaceae bacterium]|nr:hypothetical protein [Gemmatimonadaceae bacterium]